MRKEFFENILYITLLMKRFSPAFLSVPIAAILLLWSGVSAYDIGESRTGISGFGGQEYPGSSGGSLHSDFEPYVSDYSIVDSLYIVGPGDLFQVFFESSSIEKQVTPEGNIVLSRVGVIHLEGLTLRDAKTRILGYLQTTHKRDNCYVNLSRPKTMRIFVTGAVNGAGIYQFPGNYRVSDAINAASGFSNLAQRGEIRISSADGSVQSVILKKFLMEGDLKSNPYLKPGSAIHVPFIDYEKPWVTVYRDSLSFTIQLEPEETVLDAVIKSYSFYSPIPFAAVLIREKDGKDTLLSPGEAARYRPRPAVRIEVLPQKREVFVAGAVVNPGYQLYHSDRKVIQYVAAAGLQTSSKISKNIVVVRKDGRRELVSMNEGELYPGDMVYIDKNLEQNIFLYTPILLSVASLTLALISVFHPTF